MNQLSRDELSQLLEKLEKTMLKELSSDMEGMEAFVEVAVIDLIETYINAHKSKSRFQAWKNISTNVAASLFVITPSKI